MLLAGLVFHVAASIPEAFFAENLPVGALIHQAGQCFQFFVIVVDGFGRKKKTPIDGYRFSPEGLVVI